MARRAMIVLALALMAGGARAEGPWPLLVPSVPLDDESPATPLDYVPLDHAARDWRLCILYPHFKDAYWLSVNFGMVEEARRLGVSFDLHEAGGYPNLARQVEQVAACGASDADAMILGAVSFEGLTPAIEAVAARMPVIAAVNDVDDRGIAAKASVPWRQMGAAAGRVLAERHPAGSSPVRVAWFPGPEGAGWVRFVEAGFREALVGSTVEIVGTFHGDTGLEQQVLLVEEALDRWPDVDYLVGSGPMAEAAVSILRARDEAGGPSADPRAVRAGGARIVSTYMTHGVFRGIRRGRILAAPTDFPVLQGRLAVEMAVRAIEGRLEVVQAGPAIVTVTPGTIAAVGSAESLAPPGFDPIFEERAQATRAAER